MPAGSVREGPHLPYAMELGCAVWVPDSIVPAPEPTTSTEQNLSSREAPDDSHDIAFDSEVYSEGEGESGSEKQQGSGHVEGGLLGPPHASSHGNPSTLNQGTGVHEPARYGLPPLHSWKDRPAPSQQPAGTTSSQTGKEGLRSPPSPSPDSQGDVVNGGVLLGGDIQYG